ncbi:MAG TPA: hypothetical protein VJ719_11505 [Chthoniobacterales bacterium]|nr:hypothetical protein [Chthoniobacterales bacterium]
MKIARVIGCLWLVTLQLAYAGTDDILDRFGETLTFNALDGNVRARLHGTLDLETYYIDGPAPQLIFIDDGLLWNPRLSLFLDAQLGEHVYFFSQARIDRGFDPAERDVDARLDEYALRISPWKDGRLGVQLGKFATVVGNWVARHYSWDNPFVTAPLPYENLVAIWDSQAAHSVGTLLGWAHVETSPGNFSGDEFSDRHLRQPVIWGPSYGTGMAVIGRLAKVDYAVEVKNTSLSSQPQTWSGTETTWENPTVSGRLGWQPNEMWKIGVSGNTGTYLREDAEPTLAPGHSLSDYRQIVIAQDVGFSWRHLQIWAEFFETRFEVPTVANVHTFAYYLEAKYKFAPQWFGAMRWNQQLFGTVTNQAGQEANWGRDVWQIDSAIGYRLTAHTQAKLQYTLQHERSAPRNYGHMVAAQITVRF